VPSTGRAILLCNYLKYGRCGCIVISGGIQKCVEIQSELVTEMLFSGDRTAILEICGDRQIMC
jgi:hypothetical protein